MKAQEVVDRFRSEIQDQALPYLWPDEDAYSYLNDAQEMFCRLEGGIADSSSAITRVQAITGQAFSPISPKILKIRQAVRSSDYKLLEALNAEDMLRMSLEDDYGTMRQFTLDDTTGEIRAYVAGLEQDKLRWVYIPEADLEINLTVYRLPLVTLNDAHPDQELEIHTQHHRHLTTWMKHLAYLKQDAETYDRAKATEFEERFINYCSQARKERERREHKYREMSYGGI